MKYSNLKSSVTSFRLDTPATQTYYDLSLKIGAEFSSLLEQSHRINAILCYADERNPPPLNIRMKNFFKLNHSTDKLRQLY